MEPLALSPSALSDSSSPDTSFDTRKTPRSKLQFSIKIARLVVRGRNVKQTSVDTGEPLAGDKTLSVDHGLAIRNGEHRTASSLPSSPKPRDSTAGPISFSPSPPSGKPMNEKVCQGGDDARRVGDNPSQYVF